ncbi:segregation and condensation protein A [Endosaccharibacter trunci]
MVKAEPASDAGPGAASAPVSAAPMLQLDGFEGPLDLLLDLARAQKVDLARISILTLVEQYLAVVRSAPVGLELAADWLVMAAWLAWLKSRLLLPDDPAAAEEGEIAAEALQERLLELSRIGEAARWLDRQPQLGRDVFPRGAAEQLREIDRSGLSLDMGQLLAAYMAACRRTARRGVYRPRPPSFWTVQDALERLRRLVGDVASDWCTLEQFLPSPAETPSNPHGDPGWPRRAALAGTLIAGLEMAKSGAIELRQEEAFGPVMLRVSESAPEAEAA